MDNSSKPPSNNKKLKKYTNYNKSSTKKFNKKFNQTKEHSKQYNPNQSNQANLLFEPKLSTSSMYPKNEINTNNENMMTGQYLVPQYSVPQYQATQYQATQYPVPQYPVPQYQATQYSIPQYPVPQYQPISYIIPQCANYCERHAGENMNKKIEDKNDSDAEVIEWYSKGYNSGFDSGYSSGYVRGLITNTDRSKSTTNSYNDNYSPISKFSQSKENLQSPIVNNAYDMMGRDTVGHVASSDPYHSILNNSPYNSTYNSPYNYTHGYSAGYDCGIKNYIDAVNLMNTYNPNKSTSKFDTKTTTNKDQNKDQNKKNKSQNKSQNKKKRGIKNDHLAKNTKDQTDTQDNYSVKDTQDIGGDNYPPESNIKNTPVEEKKPFLIIRKITRDNKSESNDLGSMLHNLFANDEDSGKKENVNYLEDSDDENDNLVTLEDVKCNEEFKNKKKELFKDIKIISLQEIIEKSDIGSIDDLITIGNYYETNFIKNQKNEQKSTGEKNSCIRLIDNKQVKIVVEESDCEDTSECGGRHKNELEHEADYEPEHEADYEPEYENNVENKTDNDPSTEDEFKMMESIIRGLGIPITPSTNIVINNKRSKKVLLSPNKNDDASENKNIMELYKIGNVYYTINLKKVFNMRGHLIKLKKMIGLDNIKNEIIDMILYYLMEFEKKNNNMLHMTLEGSPGCGKTKLAKIISKLLGAMGILDNDKVVYARRTDMIGQYLGQTGQKTQQVINSALGGVLFIDEAYSLGSSKKDIYSKECLDILNQNLSDNKKKLVCIIAGYPDELENYFFSSNPGLTRRFPFRFKITDYTDSQLCDIFINKINKLEWKLESTLKIEDFFKDNMHHFKFFGGDIDTFIQDIKYSHSRRVVCSHPIDFRIITKKDITTAFDKFKNRRKNKYDSTVDWKSLYT
jgi:hypothetical protein